MSQRRKGTVALFPVLTPSSSKIILIDGGIMTKFYFDRANSSRNQKCFWLSDLYINDEPTV